MAMATAHNMLQPLGFNLIMLERGLMIKAQIVNRGVGQMLLALQSDIIK